MREAGRFSDEEITRKKGFGDRGRMRRSFIRAFGLPPQAVQRSASVFVPQTDQLIDPLTGLGPGLADPRDGMDVRESRAFASSRALEACADRGGVHVELSERTR
jgi:hypothetical protein